MNCRNMQRRLSAYQDDELRPSLKERISQHLQSCPACRELLVEWQELRERLESMTELEPQPRFAMAIMSRMTDRSRTRINALPAFIYSLVFAAVFSVSLLLSLATKKGNVSPATPIAVTAVLAENQQWSLLSVQSATLGLLPGEDHESK